MTKNLIQMRRKVNDTMEDFDYLFSSFSQVSMIKDDEITFSLKDCIFLQQNAGAFLGAFIRLAQHNRNIVKFDNVFTSLKIQTNLERSGFLKQLGFGEQPEAANTVPYREDRRLRANDYTEYLANKWLGRGWVHISETLKTHIYTPIIEAYVNVFDHTSSPIGAVSCGQYYPNMKVLKLALLDFGAGVPTTVSTYLKRPMLAADALQWVFQTGNSTKSGAGLARGNGLKILKSFVEENQGKLEIYSGTGYACIARGKEQFVNRSIGFTGTLVQITLQCDENYYALADEARLEDDDIF